MLSYLLISARTHDLEVIMITCIKMEKMKLRVPCPQLLGKDYFF